MAPNGEFSQHRAFRGAPIGALAVAAVVGIMAFRVGRATAPRPQPTAAEVEPAPPPLELPARPQAAVAARPAVAAEPEPAAPAFEPATDPWQGLGQSVGTPRRGWLHGGDRLRRGRGYMIRHPERTWATQTTIRHVVESIATVRRRFRRIHRLAIGDLSARAGGWLRGHVSHRSGRDVDLGLYYRQVPATYPEEFSIGTRENLHYAATWTLVKTLADTAEEPGGVRWILLDQRIQRMLYRFARTRGVSKRTLARILQFPRPHDADAGIVRHFPGHDDHIHVRFACPPNDANCSEPTDTPTGPRRTYARVK